MASDPFEKSFRKSSSQPEKPAGDAQGQPGQAEEQAIRIAVRALAETVHRSGGLAGPSYGGVSAADGQKLHQRFIQLLSQRHPDQAIQAEVFLTATPKVNGWNLQVSGRCDALIGFADGPCLIEAKSYLGRMDLLPQAGEAVHWAQACLYGWLYLAEHPELAGLLIGLAYMAQENLARGTDDLFELQRYYPRSELADFFQATCLSYIEFAGNQIQARKARLKSGLTCTFPYPQLRIGQKRFMQEVIGAARQRASAFIQAPTGTGKTMAALYPAVKIAANRIADYIFYLTAMTSTRQVAARAVDDMRRGGLGMRSIVLYAKEKLCLCPDQ
jgi:DNA excision repair protein ERCC-2